MDASLLKFLIGCLTIIIAIWGVAKILASTKLSPLAREKFKNIETRVFKVEGDTDKMKLQVKELETQMKNSIKDLNSIVKDLNAFKGRIRIIPNRRKVIQNNK
jgi:hypothetical protein